MLSMLSGAFFVSVVGTCWLLKDKRAEKMSNYNYQYYKETQNIKFTDSNTTWYK